MDTQNPQIIVDPLRCPMLSPLGLPVPDYNGCIQLMLGKVVENKIVPTNQDPKIIQERSHTRFRPLLTNDCSGRRVGEAGGRSGSSRSRSPTNSPSIYPTNKSLEQISEKKKKLLKEGSKL